MSEIQALEQWSKLKRKELNELSKKTDNIQIKEEIKDIEKEIDIMEYKKSLENESNIQLFKRLKKSIVDNSTYVKFDQLYFDHYYNTKKLYADFGEKDKDIDIKKDSFLTALDQFELENTEKLKEKKPKKKKIKIIPHNSWEIPHKLSKKQSKKIQKALSYIW